MIVFEFFIRSNCSPRISVLEIIFPSRGFSLAKVTPIDRQSVSAGISENVNLIPPETVYAVTPTVTKLLLFVVAQPLHIRPKIIAKPSIPSKNHVLIFMLTPLQSPSLLKILCFNRQTV
jgi:hypothetical protein